MLILASSVWNYNVSFVNTLFHFAKACFVFQNPRFSENFSVRHCVPHKGGCNLQLSCDFKSCPTSSIFGTFSQSDIWF